MISILYFYQYLKLYIRYSSIYLLWFCFDLDFVCRRRWFFLYIVYRFFFHFWLEINFRRQCIKQDINKPWCFWNKVILIAIVFVWWCFNTISVISWRSVLLVGETGEPGENHRPVASHWQFYHIMLYASPWSRFHLTTSVVIDTDCIGSYQYNYHTTTATKAPQVYICMKVTLGWTNEHAFVLQGK